MSPSERTCVSCRKKGIKGELIKLANTPQGVIIDYSERLPAAGYVAGMPCIEVEGSPLKGLQSTKPPRLEDFVAESIKDKPRVASLLGMARKSGLVAAGFDSAIEAAIRDTGGLVIMAQDLSGNTKKKAMEEGTGFTGRLVEYSTKDMLGSMLGMDPVGIVFIKNKELDSLKKEIVVS
jgi:ribosomal protein L7Ae-like RNA K-turn-binding protein